MVGIAVGSFANRALDYCDAPKKEKMFLKTVSMDALEGCVCRDRVIEFSLLKSDRLRLAWGS